MALFGILGYTFKRLDCEPTPLLLGFILGPMLEEYFRRAMLFSKGSPSMFFTEPVNAGLLLTTAIILILVLVPSFRKTRREAFVEE